MIRRRNKVFTSILKITASSEHIYQERKNSMKQDLATAYRQMKSPNIKTRKRALKLIHEVKRGKKK